MRYGLQGPNETICTACAARPTRSANAARLDLHRAMSTPWSPVAARSAVTLTAIAGFTQHDRAVVERRVSRPFDADRDGFVIGEGAAVLILEEWSTAERARRDDPRRDARRGVSNADAHHITAPSPGGVGAIDVHAARARRRRPRPGRHRADQRARHVDPAQRRRRGRSDRRGVRRAPVRRSRRPRASPATRSAPPVRWRPPPSCCRSSTS